MNERGGTLGEGAGRMESFHFGPCRLDRGPFFEQLTDVLSVPRQDGEASENYDENEGQGDRQFREHETRSHHSLTPSMTRAR